MNSTDPRDDFTISPAAAELYANPDGSWQIGRETGSANTGLRMYVISPDGWRDVEMTGYMKLKSYTFDEEFAWAAKSCRQTTSNRCDGKAYYGALRIAGNAFLQRRTISEFFSLSSRT